MCLLKCTTGFDEWFLLLSLLMPMLDFFNHSRRVASVITEDAADYQGVGRQGGGGGANLQVTFKYANYERLLFVMTIASTCACIENSCVLVYLYRLIL